MADFTAQASTLRAGKWQGSVYGSFIPQTTVLTGTVTSLSQNKHFYTFSFSYTNLSGSYTNVTTDMRIAFYSSGVYIGESRVAIGDTISSTHIPMAETSLTEINLVAGCTFKIFDDYRLLNRLVAQSLQFEKDSRLSVGSYATNPPPVANAGGLWAGRLDAGQTYATVTFSASDSFVVDPDSGGTLTYLWNVKDGTITVGSTTTVGITVHFPVGFRHISLTVTDAGNSVSTTRYVPVWAYDFSTYSPLQITSLELSSSLEQGWGGDLAISYDQAQDITIIPDGALLVLWEEAYYGGSMTSYRSNVSGRSHILSALFLESDSIQIDAEQSALTFHAESPLSVLARTPALPQLMKSGSTADWQHLKSLSVNRALWYLIWWHATALTYFDFLWFGGTDFSYSEFQVQSLDTILAQLRDVASAINTLPTCDALGRILIIQDPNFLAQTDRASRVTTFNLTTDQDILTFAFTRTHHGSAKQVTGSGIKTVDFTPLFATTGSGSSPIEPTSGAVSLNRQIIASQADLNQRTGKFYAITNGLYNGRRVPKKATVSLPDGYAIFDPAYLEFITVTLATADNYRGIAFSTTRWTVDEVSIRFNVDTGGRDVELTISHETDGADGIPFTPKSTSGISTDVPPISAYGPGVPIITYDPLPSSVGAPTGKLFGIEFGHDKAFATTTNGTTWFLVGSGTITGNLIDWCSDPYNYGRKYIISKNGLWRVDDPYGAPTVATLVASEATITGTAGVWPMRIQMSINRKGYILIAFGWSSVAVSTNYGATWNQYAVIGSVETSNPFTLAQRGLQHPIALSTHNNPSASNQGWVYSVQTHNLGGGIFKHYLYRSQNWGVTWSLLVTDFDVSNGDASRQLYIPHKRTSGVDNSNNSSQVVYYYRNGYLYSVTAAGVSTGLVVGGSSPGFRNANYYGLNSYTLDGAVMGAINAGTGASAGPCRFYTSPDAGVTWTDHGAFTSFGNGTIPGVMGWSSDSQIFTLAAGASVYVTLDSGATFTNITGNLVALIAADFNAANVGYDLVDYIPPS